MMWRLWLSVSLGMAIIAGSADSNRWLRAAGPPDCPQADPAASLVVRCQAARFRLVLGRLELDPPRHRQGSKAEERLKPPRLEESFTVTAERGIPSLHYTRREADREAIVDVVDAYRVQIVSHSGQANEHLQLTQPAHGAMRIEVRRGASEQAFESPSFLHLQATHPELFQRHLEPLLACLLPDVSLPQLREEATSKLLGLATLRDPPRHEEMLDWVAQLSSDRRRERERAHAKLLAYGVTIVPLLDSLPKRDLEPEQRARIAEIRRQLRPPRSDDAARVAHWLVADPQYWNAIASDFSGQERRLADRHLYQMQGEGLSLPTDRPTRIAQSPESSKRK